MKLPEKTDTWREWQERAGENRELTDAELRKMSENIANTDAGLLVFRRIKEDLLQETFDALSRLEGGFWNCSEDLVADHERTLDEYAGDREHLRRLLEDQIDRHQRGQLDMVALMAARRMHPELVRHVNETVRELAQKQSEYTKEIDTLRVDRDTVDRIVDELERKLNDLRPADVIRLEG
jgi:hypothetical protein